MESTNENQKNKCHYDALINNPPDFFTLKIWL